MIKNYNMYIKENKHSDIDPYDEEDWDDVKLPLISTIKSIIHKYGGYITMSDLQADSSPYYDETADGIHLIERLGPESVEVVIHGGYDYEEDIDEYDIPYGELNVKTLKEIKWLLENAIQNELLEEDI